MDSIRNAYDNLQVEHESLAAWCDNVWEDVFSTVHPFPEGYFAYLQTVDVDDVIVRFYTRVQRYLIKPLQEGDSRVSVDRCTWQSLRSYDIKYEYLVPVLGTLILTHRPNPENVDTRKIALSASTAYLYLVGIPGSHVYNIYNSVLYSAIMEIVQVILENCLSDDKYFQTKKNRFKEDPREHRTALSGKVKLELASKLRYLVDAISFVFQNKDLSSENGKNSSLVYILVAIFRLERVDNASFDFKLHLACRSVLTWVSDPAFTNMESSLKMVLNEVIPLLFVPGGKFERAEISDVVRRNVLRLFNDMIANLGEQCYSSFVKVVQCLFKEIPDRSEFRIRHLHTVFTVLEISQDQLFLRQMAAVAKACASEKSKMRLFAIELIIKVLLFHSNRFPTESVIVPGNESSVISLKFLFSIILMKCKDLSVNVRMRSLKAFEQLVTCSDHSITNVVYEFLSSRMNSEDLAIPFEVFFRIRRHDVQDMPTVPSCVPNLQNFMNSLIVKTVSEKVYVRKQAASTLTSILLWNEEFVTTDYMDALGFCCNDSSVLLRKSVSQNMTELLKKYPQNDLVRKCWVKAVLPLCAEQEQRAQQNMLEVIAAVLVHKIIPYQNVIQAFSAFSEENLISISVMFPWQIILEIVEQKMVQTLHYLFQKLSAAKMLPNKLESNILTYMNTEYNDVAWLLLSCLAGSSQLCNTEFVLRHFVEKYTVLETLSYGSHLIKVLFACCLKLSEIEKRQLIDLVGTGLRNFQIPSYAIHDAIDVCEKIFLQSDRRHQPSEAPNVQSQELWQWSDSVAKECELYIVCAIAESKREGTVNKNKLAKAIKTWGHIAITTEGVVDAALAGELRNILVPNLDLYRKQGPQLTPLSAVRPVICLALVKYVWHHEEAIYSLLQLFSAMLKNEKEFVNVKINAAKSLCDMCIRYSGEMFLPSVCLCFGSDLAELRISTLRSMMRKICSQFLKPRKWMLYPMFTMLRDKEESIRNEVLKYLLTEFSKKSHCTIERHFTGFICFLNNKALFDEDVPGLRLKFCLTNDEAARWELYFKILETLIDASTRVTLFSKIWEDIFVRVIGGDFGLTENCKDHAIHKGIVKDTLLVAMDNQKYLLEILKEKRFSGADGDHDEYIEADELQEQIQKNAAINEVLSRKYAAVWSQHVENHLRLWQRIKDDQDLELFFIGYLLECVKFHGNEFWRKIKSEKELVETLSSYIDSDGKINEASYERLQDAFPKYKADTEHRVGIPVVNPHVEDTSFPFQPSVTSEYVQPHERAASGVSKYSRQKHTYGGKRKYAK